MSKPRTYTQRKIKEDASSPLLPPHEKKSRVLGHKARRLLRHNKRLIVLRIPGDCSITHTRSRKHALLLLRQNPKLKAWAYVDRPHGTHSGYCGAIGLCSASPQDKRTSGPPGLKERRFRFTKLT